MSKKLSLIGGGVMGEGILACLLQENIYLPQEMLISDPSASRRQFLAETYQVRVTGDNQEAIQDSDTVLLAIKPQILAKVLAELDLDARKTPLPLIISILAGVSIERLEKAFPHYPVIRAMPNTPATVGAGITAIAPGQLVTTKHLQTATNLLQAIGKVVELPENLLDGVTGLSGSGPAYVALMVEALTDGGVATGLPRAIAAELALQTVLGTAKLLEIQQLHPALLKDKVTSPGGTTIAAVAELEKAGFRSALIEAVKAAANRSRALGES